MRNAVSGAVDSIRQLAGSGSAAQTPPAGAPRPAGIAQDDAQGTAPATGPSRAHEATQGGIDPSLISRPTAPKPTTPAVSPLLPASAHSLLGVPTPPASHAPESTSTLSDIDGESLDGDSLDGRPMAIPHGAANQVQGGAVKAVETESLPKADFKRKQRLFESSSEEEDDDKDEIDELMDEDDDPPVASASAVKLQKRTQPKPVNHSNATPGPSRQQQAAGTPRYTTELVKNNSAKNRHVIRIAPGISDGLTSTWPKNTQVDGMIGGKLNWHRAIARGETKDVMWREKIGDNLAQQLNVPSASQFWILGEFPANYKFYEHLTGESAKAAKIRSDPYLFGSHRTRSPYETVPHFLWLCRPPGTARCECKYCSKTKLQREINSGLGITSIGTPVKKVGGSPAPSNSSVKRPNQSPLPVDVVKKKAFVPKLKSKPTPTPTPAPPKPVKVLGPPSYNGVYAADGRAKDLGESAMYRVGELVWMELPKPIIDPTGQDDTRITHWPAIVAERYLFNKGTVIPSSLVATPGTKSQPKFSFKLSWAYDVAPLACSNTLKMSEVELMPFHARPTPTFHVDSDSTEGMEHVVQKGKEKRADLDALKTLGQARIAYALALHTTLVINVAYSFLDRYTINPNHLTSLTTLSPEDNAVKLTKLKMDHYQCVWIGPELIWNGELVRLTLDQTDSDGLPDGLLPRSAGAEHRTFFLLISSIWRVTEEAGKTLLGSSARAQVTGTIYELHELGTPIPVDGKAANPAKVVVKPRYMPKPPAGFAFRLLNPPGTNYGCEFDMIAGRYYPIPENLPRVEVDAAIKLYGDEQRGDREVELNEKANIARRHCNLAGFLPPGIYPTSSCWVIDRQTTVLDAEKRARESMKEYFEGVPMEN